jgi:hypothetical protein
MRKKLITALVLGACVGTQAFAATTATYQVKQGVINFALTRQFQSQPNITNFIPAPLVYKTSTAKIATVNVLNAISWSMYGIPNQFTSKAQLIFGPGGEVHGDEIYNLDHNPELAGFFGTFGGPVTSDIDAIHTEWVFSAANNGNVTLDNGRNHHINYYLTTNPTNASLYVTNYVAAPTGLSEPWGQIWVRDPGQIDPYTGVAPLCINVTFFFCFNVKECYDCLYLNSFISDSTFKQGKISGPPCCSPTFTQGGSGVDHYYLTLNFDNTTNNPNLNWTDDGDEYDFGDAESPLSPYALLFPNFYGGLDPTDNGIVPDALPPGGTDYHNYDTYEMRFTLNGILTYNWSLKLFNSTDVNPDFIGSASYPAYGYGFIAKTCCLINGTVTISESLVPECSCCDVLWTSNSDDNEDYLDSAKGLYGDVDGFYTPFFGHYHPYNNWIFYHTGYDFDYMDFVTWWVEEVLGASEDEVTYDYELLNGTGF